MNGELAGQGGAEWESVHTAELDQKIVNKTQEYNVVSTPNNWAGLGLRSKASKGYLVWLASDCSIIDSIKSSLAICF